MKFIFNKKILVIFTAVVLLAFGGKVAIAVWNNTFYEPGDTLNPECLPTQTDCDVRAPLTATSISDTVYGASWDADTTHAPSKNAIYDKIESLPGGHDAVTLGTANGLSLSTQVLSLALASTSTTGALSSTDWNTFNNKQPAGSYLTSVGTGVANELTYWSGTNTLGSLATATYPSLTEVSYVKGVTSALQTQLNAKGVGDMVLASAQTNSGIKTFLDTTMKLRNVANTFDGYFVNTNTADRIYTLQNAAGTIAFTSDITGTNSGTNTGDNAANSSTMFIGTTSVALNRASAALALTGITSIDGSAASAGKATNLVGGNNTTLLGSIPYQSNTDTTTLLSPNVTTTKKFLRMTGDGTNGTAPAWDTLVDGDIPSALTGKTYNGLTITANGTNTLNIAAGKTLTVPLDASVSGTNTGDQTLSGLGGATVALDNLASVAMNASLQFNNTADRTLDIANTANTVAGKALTVSAGSTVTGGTIDMAGGNLTLNSGLGKGTGASSIIFQTGRTLTTGSTLQTLTTAMTILGSGNVGIGTTSPGNKLTVTGDAINIGLHALSSGPNTLGLKWINYVGTDISSITSDTVVGDLLFNPYAVSNAMVVKAITGNVGIGTTNPGALLDLGLAGTTLGVVRLAGSTSGNVSLQPNVIAGTGIVLTLPATTGTLVTGGGTATGTNTGDQTITLTGGVTGSGTGSFAATVITNANLTGPITSVGNATSVASQTGTGSTFVMNTSPTLVTPVLGVATGTSLALTYAGTTAVTTASGLVLNGNSLTTGTGFYAASSTLTSGLLMDLQVSGTAAAASQTALNILTTGATATNAITTYGGQISNTHTNVTSGTNVALYLNASGATTANYGLIVNAGSVGIGTAGPDASLDVLNASAAQLRLTQADGTVYSEFQTVVTTGDLQIASTGGNVRLNNENLFVCSGGSCGSTVTGEGNLVVETGISLDGGAVITLGENAAIKQDPALSADGKYNGLTRAGTAGTTLAFGDLVYLDPTDSRWELADANAAAAADGDATGILGMVVLAAAADGDPTTILLNGTIRADASFPAMTVNSPMYVSETAGDITGTQPTTTDAVIKIIGFPLTADELYFNPSNDYMTHT